MCVCVCVSIWARTRAQGKKSVPKNLHMCVRIFCISCRWRYKIMGRKVANGICAVLIITATIYKYYNVKNLKFYNLLFELSFDAIFCSTYKLSNNFFFGWDLFSHQFFFGKYFNCEILNDWFLFWYFELWHNMSISIHWFSRNHRWKMNF